MGYGSKNMKFTMSMEKILMNPLLYASSVRNHSFPFIFASKLKQKFEQLANFFTSMDSLEALSNNSLNPLVLISNLVLFIKDESCKHTADL